MTQTSEGMVRATRVAPDRGLRFAMRAFGNRDFAIFWCGAMVTNVGGWFQSLSAPYVLYDITQSATWVGLAVAGQFLPGSSCRACCWGRWPARSPSAATCAARCW